MGRKTKQNKITSPELIAQINPKNIRLMNDFLDYLIGSLSFSLHLRHKTSFFPRRFFTFYHWR